MRNARGTEIGPSALAKAAKRREKRERAIHIRMTYRPDGKTYVWKVRKAKGGWEFEDHEGYSRFAEGNWFDLVARFKMVAENYCMDCNIS